MCHSIEVCASARLAADFASVGVAVNDASKTVELGLDIAGEHDWIFLGGF